MGRTQSWRCRDVRMLFEELGSLFTLDPCRPANPSYTAEELIHQLTLTKARLLVTHSASLETAIEASRVSGITMDRIVLIDGRAPSVTDLIATTDELVEAGRAKPTSFNELQFRPGDAKTTLALLCFSSGTTGKAKAVAVSHYAMIANVLQFRLAAGKPPRYVPGDVALGGTCILNSSIAIHSRQTMRVVLPFFREPQNLVIPVVFRG